MSGRLDDLDYYTLMGVNDDASLADVKRAFRDFARRYHPDNYVGQSEAKIEQAAAIYRRGSEAYQVLTDATLRAAYDNALQEGKLRLSAEDVDRALAPEPEPAKKPAVPIASAQALQQYKAGIAAAHNGDWKKAWRHLREAHRLEPDNEFIASRFYRVERKLRR
ncbi:MAG: DnaJ domain-containing protein [Myxococcota bacterium]